MSSGSSGSTSAERELAYGGSGESGRYIEITGNHRIEHPYVAVDSEGYEDSPWCLSFAVRHHEAFVLRAGKGTIELGDNTTLVAHNLLWDRRIFRALGVRYTKYTDTMIMAWLLGYEFIGLKKLSGLLLGKDRDSYKDTMEVASERIGREWLTAQLAEFPRWPGPKPPDLEKTLRLIDRMLAKEESARTLRERWKDCRAREVLEDELGIIGEMPAATLDDVPLEDAIQYAGEDADDTLRIFPILDKRIDEMGLRDVLNVDLAVIPMVCRMQEVGIKADADHFRALSVLYADEATQLAKEIREMGGPENPGSSPDVAEWLFGTLRLPCRKKTKGGERSTDKKVLEALVKNPKIQGLQRRGLETLMEYKQVMKLKGTYADKMPDFISKDGRLHPNLSLTTVPTGRLAAKNPNVLAFPKHSERGKLIRAGFVADEGCELGEWDLSQIELRILAIDSGDERMLAQFMSGHDFHLMGAAERYGKKPEDVSKHERFTQKAINFGIVMGITEYGLLDQFLKNGQTRGVKKVWNRVREEYDEIPIQWTTDDCKAQLEDWRRSYPQASAYLLNKHAEAYRYGYVRDLWGRLRYIEDIASDNNYFEEEAKRQAQATPVQSGAQGLVKRWMIGVWQRLPRLWAQGIRVECLLQVHDALLFEYRADARPAVHNIVQEALDDWQCFPIPITMEGAWGQRLSDL